MRFFTATAATLGLCAMALAPVAAHANADKAARLAKIEAKGLGDIGTKRLAGLVTSQQTAGDGNVKFSRAWVDAQPKAAGGAEWRCLAEALYFEARGETIKGQFAVAEVIKNRVRSDRFPSSFCAVINQGTGKKYQCQFTYTCDGHAEVIRDQKSFVRVGKIARATLTADVPELTDGAMFYHTTAVKPRWASVFTRTTKIGVHLFYRKGKRVASNG